MEFHQDQCQSSLFTRSWVHKLVRPGRLPEGANGSRGRRGSWKSRILAVTAVERLWAASLCRPPLSGNQRAPGDKRTASESFPLLGHWDVAEPPAMCSGKVPRAKHRACCRPAEAWGIGADTPGVVPTLPSEPAEMDPNCSTSTWRSSRGRHSPGAALPRRSPKPRH